MTGFDNQAFWDARYRENLPLGSGAGSRGEFLNRKRHLLQNVVAHVQPHSIIDVGCGDIEATRCLAFGGAYTGIDVSPFVVERNRAIRPDWQFAQGDFVALAAERNLQADLVICLDVLIHQHDPEIYRTFVQRLLQTARYALLVNGFTKLPRSGKLSPNVAFHEPITTTLQQFGAKNIKKLAEVRRTSIVLVTGNEGPGREPFGYRRLP